MKKQQSHINVETQSFIVHESTIRMSSLLSDEELGRLIRHFYLYTENGLTPDDEPNLAVTIIFNEWMLRYQSDKEQYETVRQQKKYRRKTADFFYRQTAFVDSTCYEYVEAFLSGHSAVALSELKLEKDPECPICGKDCRCGAEVQLHRL